YQCAALDAVLGTAAERDRASVVSGGDRPVLFFFSSRRRHTSSYGDWSSDVCSSDLPGSPASWRGASVSARNSSRATWTRATASRSEERRVGKECRSRWSRYL